MNKDLGCLVHDSMIYFILFPLLRITHLWAAIFLGKDPSFCYNYCLKFFNQDLNVSSRMDDLHNFTFIVQVT